MRRLALAVLSAALVLSACSDQSPTEPEVPAPEETFGSTCQVERFPLLAITPLVRDVFPNGRLRLEAFARLGAIKLFWDTCHPDAARRLAVAFIQWMNSNFDDGKLRGATAEEVQALTVAVLSGVGVPVTPPAAAGGIGVGVYTGEELLVKTADKTALTKIDADAFNDDDPRLIVTKRLGDASKPLDIAEDRQFAPFFDYDATKLSGEPSVAHKKLADGKFAIIAFCLFAGFEYPNDARIGHNQVVDDDRPTFELLDPFDLRDGEGQLTELGQELECENLASSPGGGEGGGEGGGGVIGSFGSGLPNLAHAALGTADRLLRPIARTLLLPQPLSATALVGFLGPIGGKTTSLSPFGTVEGAQDHLEFVPGWDPGDNEEFFLPDTPLEWFESGCIENCIRHRPFVRLVTADGSGIPGVEVQVTLNQLEGSTGTFTGRSATVMETGSGAGPEDTGFAEFDNLSITGPTPGTYTITFSAPGATPVTSGQFTVNTTSVSGTISSALLGPIEGALVTLSPGGQSATSDAAGNYEVTGVSATGVVLTVTGIPTSCFHPGPSSLGIKPGGNVRNFMLVCRKVAYQRFVTPDYEIAVMNADGTGQLTLTNNEIQELDPSWSPDGTKLAFSADGEIYVMNADGSMPAQVTDDEFFDGSPTWSPDGTRIAYSSSRALNTRAIFVIDSDGGEPSRLTPDGRDGAPAWSPDGSKIAFSRGLDLYIMNADGTMPTSLVSNERVNGNPAWSPDGSKIAFSSGVPGGEEGSNDRTYEIYVMNSDGSGSAAITDDDHFDFRPAWSPDGSKIVFVSDRAGWAVFVLNSDGTGTPTQFTPVGHSVEAITW